MENFIFYKNLKVVENTPDFCKLHFNNFELFTTDYYKSKSCTDDDINKIIYYTFNEAIICLNNMSDYEAESKKNLEIKISTIKIETFYFFKICR